jgi:cytochrome c-type biogenesis protein CcmH/NrfG
MEIARYILLGFTAASLIAFVTFMILYFLKTKKINKIEVAKAEDSITSNDNKLDNPEEIKTTNVEHDVEVLPAEDKKEKNIKTAEIEKLEMKAKKYGKIMYISAFVLLGFALGFSILNIISAIGL